MATCELCGVEMVEKSSHPFHETPLGCEIDMHREIDRLRSALVFYAERTHYEVDIQFDKQHGTYRITPCPVMLKDSGAKARVALGGIGTA